MDSTLHILYRIFLLDDTLPCAVYLCAGCAAPSHERRARHYPTTTTSPTRPTFNRDIKRCKQRVRRLHAPPSTTCLSSSPHTPALPIPSCLSLGKYFLPAALYALHHYLSLYLLPPSLYYHFPWRFFCHCRVAHFAAPFLPIVHVNFLRTAATLHLPPHTLPLRLTARMSR